MDVERSRVVVVLDVGRRSLVRRVAVRRVAVVAVLVLVAVAAGVEVVVAVAVEVAKGSGWSEIRRVRRNSHLRD